MYLLSTFESVHLNLGYAAPEQYLKENTYLLAREKNGAFWLLSYTQSDFKFSQVVHYAYKLNKHHTKTTERSIMVTLAAASRTRGTTGTSKLKQLCLSLHIKRDDEVIGKKRKNSKYNSDSLSGYP